VVDIRATYGASPPGHLAIRVKRPKILAHRLAAESQLIEGIRYDSRIKVLLHELANREIPN
jgi:hypothetical protein